MDEVADDLLAVGGMHHLGMKLQAVKALRVRSSMAA